MPSREAAGFHFETGQYASGYGTDFRAKRQSIGDGLADAAAEVEAVGGRLWLDIDSYLRQAALIIDFDAEFGDIGEAADDGFEGGGEDVVAADDKHVVNAAEDAAFEAGEISAAGAEGAGEANEVAGAIADDGASEAAEVCYYQFAELAFGDVLFCVGVDDFGDAFGFEEVDAAGVVEAFDAEGADFGHAGVVEDSGAEGLFDFAARFGDVAAGFARDDEGADG